MPVDEAWLNSLKVADLKVELAKYDLPTAGKKAELADRLKAHLEANDGAAAEAPAAEAAPAAEESKPSRKRTWGPEQGSEDVAAMAAKAAKIAEGLTASAAAQEQGAAKVDGFVRPLRPQQVSRAILGRRAGGSPLSRRPLLPLSRRPLLPLSRRPLLPLSLAPL